MALALEPLAGPIQPAATVETTIFTAETKTRVDEIIVCNLNSTSTVFNVSIVRSGGTAGAANRIARSEPIAGHTALRAALKQTLNPGDFISVLIGTSVAVTFTVSGSTDVP